MGSNENRFWMYLPVTSAREILPLINLEDLDFIKNQKLKEEKKEQQKIKKSIIIHTSERCTKGEFDLYIKLYINLIHKNSLFIFILILISNLS